MKDVVLGRKDDGGKVAGGREPLCRGGFALWFEADFVIYRVSQPLLTSEVPLRRFHRNVPEKELDLLKFSASRMA